MFYISKRYELLANRRRLQSNDNIVLQECRWVVTFYFRTMRLCHDGNVCESVGVQCKRALAKLSGKCMNDIMRVTKATPERVALWFAEQIPDCYKVQIRDSDNALAVFVRDNDSINDDEL